MAKQTRITLKGYFQTGNIPVEQHYIDFIDSTLNLSENNIGNIDLTGNITASGDISASGVTSNHTVGGNSFNVLPSITGSIISASGLLTAKKAEIIGDITASGNMSVNQINLGGKFTAVNADITYLSGSTINTTGNITGSNGKFTGNTFDASSAAASFSTINTGQGDNELYAMNQNVTTSTAVTFATVNTGQGNNNLYGMDQNVTTNSAVEFDSMTFSSTQAVSVPWTSDKLSLASTYTHRITFSSVPDILPLKSAGPFTLSGGRFTVNSIPIASTTAPLHVMISPIASDSARVYLFNPDKDNPFTGGIAIVNLQVHTIA